MSKKISPLSLVLLIVASIDSIRNLPAAALFGPALIFFFILSAIIFLIPIALVSAELSATFHEQGGVYHWVRHAFGEKWAMIAIWLQWINTMIWAPTILSFIAGITAYLINPALVQDKIYLIGSILVISWTLTFVNLFGIRVSAKINDVCAVIGMVIPMLLMILLGACWVFGGHPLQIQINTSSLLPSFAQSGNWTSLIAIMASFVGMELSGVHVGDIRDPQRNFPKAMLLASCFLLFTMLFGSLAIAFVVPETEINLISGVMQVFSVFFTSFHIPWCAPFLAILIVIGTIGGLINWFTAPAKGLLQAAERGFLPPFLAKKNRYETASRILFAQALVISLLCIAFLFVPSVNGFYWFLTALSTSMYMLVYILIFLSALRLRSKSPSPQAFRIPGGPLGLWIATLFGLFACLATITVSFFPPDNIDIGTPLHYVLMIVGGTLLSLLPALFILWRRKRV